MGKKTPLKALDILVIALSLALTVALGGAVYSGESSASQVVIRSPDKTWIYPVGAELELKIVGAIGETRVRIHDGRAAIVSSPCDGQTCVAAGSFYKNGQWAACLPNRIIVLIEGSNDAVDAVSF